jgi:hypothetical protein
VTPGPTPATAAAFRCSTASRELSEPLAGSASTVRAFLLLEVPGPWGLDAVRDCRLDEDVRHRLLHLERAHALRPLLIRRRDRATGPRRMFAAHVDRTRPWLETAVLEHVRELLDLDLTGLARGRSPGLTRHADPLFLICTHGRHDACCAERGRPLSAALSAVAPDHTWEVSHIGGDRFAGNVLLLPHGLYYGRLTAADAAGFVETHRSGALDLEHLRGRSSYPFPVQAGEVFLRRHLQDHRLEPFPLEEHSRDGEETCAVFAVDGARWEARVHSSRGVPRQLTCRAGAASPALSHRLLGLTRL